MTPTRVAIRRCWDTERSNSSSSIRNQGVKVKISGFGNFVVRDKNSRKGRNPQTGQEILLEARKVLTFKPSLVLKNLLNEEGADPRSDTHVAEG